MTQRTHQRTAASGRTVIALLAMVFVLGACGGGGGGGSSSGGGNGGGGASPSQPVESVPDSAMSSTSSFMRFIAAWKVDDTVEPFELSDRPPPRDDGSAMPIGQ